MRKMSRAAVFTAVFCLITLNFVFAAEKIDINTAPLEDLIKIVHIGETRAQELISLRPFSSLNDLIRIKGIGEKRVEDIKKQALAWVDLSINAIEAEPQMEEAKPLPNSELAAAGEPIRQAQGKPFNAVQGNQTPILLAIAIAISSGITILILKKRLK
ncbi:MAG: helix-hairpin-helix domain-containing protein [Candidatus Nealsonbacteria bacterium]